MNIKKYLIFNPIPIQLITSNKNYTLIHISLPYCPNLSLVINKLGNKHMYIILNRLIRSLSKGSRFS